MVRLRSPAPYMGDFPSGQRGQTVNLLSPTSMVRIHLSPPKKSTSFDLSIFLFKPQAWYVITRQRVGNRRRCMESPKVHFLRLDSIPSCNGFHTMLCIDSIHAFRRDLVHEFKSVRKLLKISFLFKPQAWYGITRQRVCNRRRRMESLKHPCLHGCFLWRIIIYF